MTLNFWDSHRRAGTPLYYLQKRGDLPPLILESSIEGLETHGDAVLLRLHDGHMLNAGKVGKTFFWSEAEARKAGGIYGGAT